MGLDIWTIALTVFGSAVGVQFLAKRCVDSAGILGGLGLASAAGQLMRAIGYGGSPGAAATKDDPFPALADGKLQDARHPPSDQVEVNLSPDHDAMQRAVAQARSSYSPAEMDGASRFSGPMQGTKSLSKRFS